MFYHFIFPVSCLLRSFQGEIMFSFACKQSVQNISSVSGCHQSWLMVMNPLVKFSPVISMCSFELSRVCTHSGLLWQTLALITCWAWYYCRPLAWRTRNEEQRWKTFAQLCGSQLLGEQLVHWNFIWMYCAQRVYLDCPAFQRKPISISKLTSFLKCGSCHDFET